jgi:hypothetical protein
MVLSQTRSAPSCEQAHDMSQAEMTRFMGTHAPKVPRIEHHYRGVCLQQEARPSTAMKASPEAILWRGRLDVEKKRPLGPNRHGDGAH